jgi:hypothetical protein
MRRLGVASVLTVTIILAWAVPRLAAPALPSTPLALLDGGSLDLQGLQGNVVVLRFLASW